MTKCPLLGGVRLQKVSAYKRCLLMGGVYLQKVSAYGRCLPTERSVSRGSTYLNHFCFCIFLSSVAAMKKPCQPITIGIFAASKVILLS